MIILGKGNICPINNMNPIRHRAIIVSGCILWGLSFVGDIKGALPYATYGLIISPLLLMTGIIIWLKYYRNTKGYYPRFSVIKENMLNFGVGYTLRSDFLMDHKFEFWTFCIGVWMGMYLLAFLAFNKSEAFKAAKIYCKSNKEIQSKIGHIRYFSTMVAGSITTGDYENKADLFFTIVSDSGIYSTFSIVKKHGQEWSVDSVAFNQ